MKKQTQLLKRLNSSSSALARIKGAAKEQTELGLEVAVGQAGAFSAGVVDGYLVDDTIGDSALKYTSAAAMIIGIGAMAFGRKALGRTGQKAAVHYASGMLAANTYTAGIKAGEALRKKVDD